MDGHGPDYRRRGASGACSGSNDDRAVGRDETRRRATRCTQGVINNKVRGAGPRRHFVGAGDDGAAASRDLDGPCPCGVLQSRRQHPQKHPHHAHALPPAAFRHYPPPTLDATGGKGREAAAVTSSWWSWSPRGLPWVSQPRGRAAPVLAAAVEEQRRQQGHPCPCRWSRSSSWSRRGNSR